MSDQTSDETSHDTSDETIERAVDVLRAGGLVAFPTETVYGLGAAAADPTAVRRIFAAKNRPADHPLIVHLPSVASLDEWAAEVPPSARRLADRFWPGPLTLILRRAARVPTEVTGRAATIGLRVPSHPVALELLERFGDAVAAPSANRHGSVSPTRAEHVRADLGDRVDVVLDGGACRVGLESTIVDLTSDRPAVLRPGAITVEELGEVIDEPVIARATSAVRAPGNMPSHYAPAARVVISDADGVVDRARELVASGLRVVVLAWGAQPVSGDLAVVRLSENLDDAARELYDALRRADGLGADVLVTSLPTPDGVGAAIADRLRRAAGPRPDAKDRGGS